MAWKLQDLESNIEYWKNQIKIQKIKIRNTKDEYLTRMFQEIGTAKDLIKLAKKEIRQNKGHIASGNYE